MDNRQFVLIVAGMALVTYIPRLAPLLLLSRRRIPAWLSDWLDLVPAAILAALVALALLTADGPRRLDLLRPELLAALPTLVFAVWTRSLGGTVLVGMASLWLLRRLF